jgi:hypothetical protein
MNEKLPTVTLRSPEGKQAPEGKRILSALSAAFHGKEPFDVAPSM